MFISGCVLMMGWLFRFMCIVEMRNCIGFLNLLFVVVVSFFEVNSVCSMVVMLLLVCWKVLVIVFISVGGGLLVMKYCVSWCDMKCV